MKQLIGMWIIFTALNFGGIAIFGFDMGKEEKIITGVCLELFLTLILIGSYLIAGQKGAFKMYNIMTTIFTILGIVCFMIGGSFIVISYFCSICKKMGELKYKYECKHRFDKPSIARCYCIDCAYYSKDSGQCLCHDKWYVNEADFCSEAYPRKHS